MNKKFDPELLRLLANTERALRLTEYAWLKSNEEWNAHAISDDAFRELETFKADHPEVKMRDMRAAFIGDGDAKPPSVV